MKCSACGAFVEARHVQCPQCERWGTIARWYRITAVATKGVVRVRTGVAELDGLLGGGFVSGGVYRVSGPPGCGKSTVALDIASRVPALYAAAEERDASIRLRFDRITARQAQRVEPLIGEIESVEDLVDIPDDVKLLVVDSINRLQSTMVAGAAGSNMQLTHAAERLVALARGTGVAILSIAHVNREGDAAGTTRVDHDVDGVLEMADGVLRVKKHRHGPVASIGVELVEEGVRYHAREEEAEEARPPAA